MKLTLPQQDVYFEQLLYPTDPIYNIGARIEIEGNLEIKAFQQAYLELIKQHDTYRTVLLKNAKGEVTTQVTENGIKKLGLLDFSNKRNSRDHAIRFMQREFAKPFELLKKQALYSFILIKVADKVHYLFSVYHHIITDGWGTSLMFQRLVKNYKEILENGKVVSEYPFTYREFALYDEQYQDSDAYHEDKEYWLNQFKVLPENLFEKIDTTSKDNKSARKTLFIKRKVYDKLNTLAKGHKVSTVHLLLGILYVYFGRKQQNYDFAIGLPVLNRSKATFKRTVGLFMGINPLRIQFDLEDTFQSLVQGIRAQLRKNYRYQRFPLGKLIQQLQLFEEKDKLFNISFSYEKQNYANHFEGTQTTVIPLTHQSERLALAIYVREFDQEADIHIDFDYNLNYFDEFGGTQLVQHFEELLHAIIKNPDLKIAELKYLTNGELEKIGTQFNNTRISYDKDATFLDLFKKQAQHQPNKIAVLDQGKRYTYSQLDQVSNQIAEYLLQQENQESTSHIGVLVDRSVYTIAILLGIIKAGKSYIPLDPLFPADRLKYIIEHSGLRTLISSIGKDKDIFKGVNVLEVEELLKSIQNLKGIYDTRVQAEDTAYIIYTSGSTGNPKGVEIGHRSLLNFLLSMSQNPGINSTDTLFAVTTYSFDISILEFFGPLIAGASVYIVDNKTLSDPEKIVGCLTTLQPSIIQATPSFYQLLLNAGWKGNHQLKVWCGGDLLSEDLARNLLDSCTGLWNMYGPTETTIWSSVKKIVMPEDASNIGSPIANTQMYILDDSQQIKPIGSHGDLYIAGDGLAKGYFKDLELTQQKFIPNPLNPGEIIYKTNDLAKWNQKGELEFLGRNDNQVKIRGYRIELEEIETKLNLIPEIRQSVVVPKRKDKQEAFLVAYVLKENAAYNEQNCIVVLEQQLPRYMVPYIIIPVESFPLTPNKKINRKILAEKDIHTENIVTQVILPQTKLQKKLMQYWQDTLNYKAEIGLAENYFALGGHSLNAVKLVHSIKNELQYDIQLRTIFDYPTIGKLANYLSGLKQGNVERIPKAEFKEYYPVTPSQYNIWFASQNTSKSIAYNMATAFQIKGSLDIAGLNQSIGKLLVKHEILRTNFIEKEGLVWQKINPADSISFETKTVQASEIGIRQIIETYTGQAFDFETDQLIKILLLQSPEKNILVFCTHHLIMDGWSLECLTKEFISHYNNERIGLMNGQKNIQFKDYSVWLQTKTEQAKKQHRFWDGYLANCHARESFKTDLITKTPNYAGHQLRFELEIDETMLLRHSLAEHQTTMHNFLVAILAVLIFKVSKHRDILLGTVNSGRANSQLADMIGMFVQTLPLRIQLSEQQNFEEVLEIVQQNVLETSNQLYSLPHLTAQQTSDVLLVYQNPSFFYEETIDVKGGSLVNYPLNIRHNRLPLLFNFFEAENTLKLDVSYDTLKYEPLSVELLWLKYKQILKGILADSSVKIADLEIILEQKEKVEFDFDF